MSEVGRGRPGVFLDRDGTVIVDRDYPGDADGVELLTGRMVDAVEKTADGVAVVSGGHRIEGSHLLVAVGRAPVFDGLNLAAAGGSVIGAGAQVEGEVEESVVWPGARVRAGEHLRRAIRTDAGTTVLIRRDVSMRLA